ncbi:MAG: Maf family protein [Myxococcota bacterium]
MPPSSAFVLASASPRRRELLSRAGLHPQVVPSDVDERVLPGEDAVVYAVRVATEKARVGPPGAHILAADTVVALGGEILGKPRDAREAVETLVRLSGREHEVHTAVAFRRPGAEPSSFVVTTKVRFRTLDPSEIEAYVATGEPLDKAGAYGVQGHGGALTASLHGSYTNVVGLPLEETLRLLDAEGLR